MKQPPRVNEPHLIWDSNDCRVVLKHVSVMITPETYQPFVPLAVVQEQDSFLLMGEQGLVVEPEQPAWALANRLDVNPVLKPGSVIRKGCQPLRLLAIIHDVEQSPTWKTQWIEQALENIFSALENLSLASLKLPLLASSCHDFSEADFFRILARVISQRAAEQPLKIWIPCNEASACKPLASCLLQAFEELNLR